MGTYSFDVIRDSWIPVKRLTGEKECVNLRTLFENAHEYQYLLDEPNILYSYGVYNFLVAMFASIYHPETIEDKEEILESGHFEISKFDAYIQKCEKNRPNCFNLFGENPFYQNKYATMKESKKTGEIEKNKPTMVGKIALHIPSGNNSFFFSNDELIGKKIDFIECVKALLSYGHFQPEQDGPNTAKGVNGLDHPMYFVLKGNTLFDCVVLNTITEETWKSISTTPYIGNAAWEMEPEKNSKKLVKSVSMVEGLTFQSRQVLINEEDIDSNKLITTIYFKAGNMFDFKNNVSCSLWHQPNSAYYQIKDKKTEEPLNEYRLIYVKDNKYLWTTFGDIFNLVNSKVRISTVSEYLYLKSESDVIKSKYLSYMIFYATTASGYGPFGYQGMYLTQMPVGVLQNEEYLKTYNSLLRNVSSIGERMTFNFREDKNKVVPGKKPAWKLDDERCANEYYSVMDMKILPKFLKAILDIDYSDVSAFYDICDSFKKEVKNLAVSIYKDIYLKQVRNGLIRCDNDKIRGKYGNLAYDLSNFEKIVNSLLS